LFPCDRSIYRKIPVENRSGDHTGTIVENDHLKIIQSESFYDLEGKNEVRSKDDAPEKKKHK
jgi:hypothetical protein